MKNSVGLILRLGLVLVLVSTSGCSSFRYSMKSNQSSTVEVTGGRDVKVENWWLKIFAPGGPYQPSTSFSSYLLTGFWDVISAPIWLIFCWEKKINEQPLRAGVPIMLQDAQAKPIVNVPATVNGSAESTDDQGRLSIRIEHPNPANPQEPISDLTQIVFPEWKTDFEEKGDAVEYAPPEINLFLECSNGQCQITDADHKPIDKFVFTVNVIKHHDDKIVAAYQAKLAEVEKQKQEKLAKEKAEMDQEAEKNSAMQLVANLYSTPNAEKTIGEGGSPTVQGLETVAADSRKRASEGDAEAALKLQVIQENFPRLLSRGWEAEMIEPHLWKVEYWESFSGGMTVYGNPLPPSTEHSYWRVDTQRERIKPLTLYSWVNSDADDASRYLYKHQNLYQTDWKGEIIDWLPWFQVVKTSSGKSVCKKVTKEN